MQQVKKIQTFTDLVVWQEGHRLVLSLYDLTKTYPKEETYGIINQMRRASISVTSNIAEGFSRSTGKERALFYKVSLGSLMELQNQFIVSRDLRYITENEYRSIYAQTLMVQRLLYGLINRVSG